jgi:hypothetical protein
MKALHGYCENGTDLDEHLKESSLDDHTSATASSPEDDVKEKENQMTSIKEVATETLHCENSRHCETPNKRVQKQQMSDQIFTHFTEEQLLSLFVKNKNGEKTMFCDLGKLSVINLHVQILISMLF